MNKTIIGMIVGVVFLGIIIGLLLLSGDDEKKEIEANLEVSFLSDAGSAASEGRFLEARRLYKKAMDNDTIENINELKKIQKRIEEINMRIIFSPAVDECSAKYIVKPRDALVKIARKFNTTVSLIKRANNLSSDIIRPNQPLKVNTCKFSIAVDKSQNLLFLKRKGEVIKTYSVSTGKDGSTPVGNFRIVNKLTNPTWYKVGAVVLPDDPENVLGSRWLGFDIKGYGIHGTIEPDNLGQQITLGCVRMENKEVEELFDIVPTGTEVIVVE